MATPTAPPLTSPPESPTGFASKLSLLAADIKLSHTVFALPFALLGAGLACGWAQRLPRVSEVVLVLVCMVLARTFAMCVNRLADAGIDAKNPRTEQRAVASGRLTRGFAAGTIAVTGLGFIAATAGFWLLHDNFWPTALAVPVLGVLALYSVTKRFTWLCHLVLGFALAISPLAAAIAIEPGYLQASATLWLIAGMVLCWVAGFDVIYALQDVGVDRELGLFSMPASLGVEPALWISRTLHVLALACLAGAWWISPQLGVLFGFAVVLTSALLILEHALVWRSATNHIHMAFFTVNGIISLLLGLAGLLDAGLAA
ncbi:UbiA-like polyprenyltransferase [Algisphaera agarilytica]|uniref:4-hydroxybenzoate polyprenyltransferase n=1 Tax=Algisphaera agarilytica TaxID=1385975 RepID=A0A7X0LLB0_9BACT|nr:UbiA-like polyprenyltransferase [Algisphaera agarilytica]MBB6431310.1 4-hydroxybenzoate polyprenyltransferase [Algisphaera agarilytica]